MSFNSSGNSIQKTAPVVFNLLIINALVFLAQMVITGFDITEWGALHYITSSRFKPHQFITNMFMHGGVAHILFNMFGLWMFGTILERFLGSKRFLIFYLICGIGAGILIELTVPFSANQYLKSSEGLMLAAKGAPVKDIINYYKEVYLALGASGAIMGIMAAFAYLFPNTEMFVMFIPIPLKAKYVIPLYVLYDLFGGLRPTEGDNIGHFAHLGGAIVGFILVYIWNKKNRKTFY
ncbi:rhomboid family intramembrane serine protease [Ferruginibacter sp. SUN002]|uniref:rhomboid family intramembrane serine protease n=1 Tax=Ferruginibacter sp. SUN002 TaxID=2937789 RepID=UPI003D364D47